MSIPTSTCPYCSQEMVVCRMSCNDCEVQIAASFPASRLSRLPIEHQRFIEMFVLASGSLKEIAQQTGVSYPTVRSRLNRIIDELKTHITGSSPTGNILDVLETGHSSATSSEADMRMSAKDIMKRI
jgi:hypothetical protein